MAIKRKLSLDYLIPVLVVFAVGAAELLGLFATLDNRAYDLYLHVKQDAPENSSILLVDIDDSSIDSVGSYPWSRSVMADGLVTMKEFSADYAVFDIQYLDPSPLGVDGAYLKRYVPQLFAQQFSSLSQNMTSLFQAIASGSIDPQDAPDYINQLTGITEDTRKLLLGKVQAIARDNDVYLGQAAALFGHAYFTVNYGPDVGTESTENEAQVLDQDSIKNVIVKEPYGHGVPEIRPAIRPILGPAAGGGFPFVIVDPDGVRRRVDLVIRYKDSYFGQLAFTPLLHYLGDPEVDLYRDRIVLKGARVPGSSPASIAIPLSQSRNFLLNWPKRTFEHSFRHLSWFYLWRYQQQEDALVSLLRDMADANYFSFYSGADVLKPYDSAETAKEEELAGGTASLMDTYRQLRSAFYDNVGTFLSSDAETKILAQIDTAVANPLATDAERKRFAGVRSDAVTEFDQAKSLYKAATESRTMLAKSLNGAFCIIGATATSTTDRGANPFQSDYPNVGTHATVVNTILTGRFVRDLPEWLSIVLLALLCVLLFFVVRRLSPLPSILIGLGFIICFLGATIALFALTRIFLAVVGPLLALFVTFLVLSVMKFLSEAREKSYIRNAFGRYLSGDVVNELLADPDKMSLGGEQKELTAFFTDVKGFSTISEQLEPADLVRLLNVYLTKMSDIILDERGTIDKFEGDAIISFFGAPIPYGDHASRACAAALRMKQAEAALNETIVAQHAAPGPLLTRMGVNTGQMVVGNMGTANKMNYTIMGNSVNLAARLEGVNKQYGTWILVSESTQKACDGEFVFRMLDRVRVVGIHQPVRLFDLVAESAFADSGLVETVAHFHEGLKQFEEKQWATAIKSFDEALRIRPDDGPSQTFLKRCQEYLQKEPPATWDGVFNLSMK